MPASRKLRTAHFLMFMGVVPMLLACALVILGIASARMAPGQAGASDAFLMMALILLGYVTTLSLGVSGVLWSVYLTRRGIDQQTTATVILRYTVVVALALPLAGFAGMACYLRFVR